MPTMLQIRNVPDEIHRKLKARAALAGLSLSDYVRQELERLAKRPTRAELLRRMEQREPTRPDRSPAQGRATDRSSGSGCRR